MVGIIEADVYDHYKPRKVGDRIILDKKEVDYLKTLV